MGDFATQAIWLVGSLIVCGLIWISSLLLEKSAKKMLRRSVVIDEWYLLIGAAAGPVFSPTGYKANFATASFYVGVAIIAGAIVGGVVGVIIDVMRSRKRSQTPLIESHSTNDRPWWQYKLTGSVVNALLGLTLLAVGTLFVAARFGDMPLFNPLIRFIRDIF